MFREELRTQYSFSGVRRVMITVGWMHRKTDGTRIQRRGFQINYKVKRPVKRARKNSSCMHWKI
jgi:hypothetical protein